MLTLVFSTPIDVVLVLILVKFDYTYVSSIASLVSIILLFKVICYYIPLISAYSLLIYYVNYVCKLDMFYYSLDESNTNEASTLVLSLIYLLLLIVTYDYKLVTS